MQGVSDLIEKSFSVADQRSALRRYQYPNSMPSVGSAMRGWGTNHLTFPVFSPQISLGTHLELGRLWLSLQGHDIYPHSKPNKQRNQDSNSWPHINSYDFKSEALTTRLGIGMGNPPPPKNGAHEIMKKVNTLIFISICLWC